jgi:hypothetical protein
MSKGINDFKVNACEVSVSPDSCTVYVDLDGWDSMKRAYQDIEYFATGDNDPMGEEIEEKLSYMGLRLVYPGEVSYEGDSVDFKLEEIK